jgi:hypothetical protein
MGMTEGRLSPPTRRRALANASSKTPVIHNFSPRTRDIPFETLNRLAPHTVWANIDPEANRTSEAAQLLNKMRTRPI